MARTIPLRRRLFVLVAAGVLPLAAMAAIALVALWQQQRAQAYRAGLEIARAMSTAVDGELRRSVAALEALATNPLLAQGEIAQFHPLMRDVLERRPDWLTVILLAPDGRQLANARVPPGAALPTAVEPESLARTVATGRTTIGSMAQGARSPAIPVRVPVIIDGAVRYVLTAAVQPHGMAEILNRQRVPDDWVVAIFDATQQRVARSRDRNVELGKLPSPSLRELIAAHGDEGTGLTSTIEGDHVYTAYSRSADTGWIVSVGIPAALVEQGARKSAAAYAVGLLGSITVALVTALLIARSISRPIRALAGAAQALGRGDAPALPVTQLRELQEVGHALDAAADQRARHEAERAQLLTREQDARAAAESANRAKDEFLAMLGHELRNPLSAITNAVRILARQDHTPDQHAFATRVITRQTQSLAHMVDDLLDTGRLIAGKVSLQRSGVALDALAGDVLSGLRAGGRLDQHRVELAAEPVQVDGDRTRLEQVLNNIVANALTHTPPGGRIDVRVARRGGSAVMEVQDTGSGIAADELPRIFELFFQGRQSADRPYSGLGIGLTLVKRLVELHGGTIGVDSAGPGNGTRFVVTLPAIETRAAEPAARSTPAPAHLRVLLVEDNDDARETLRIALEMDGHRVVTACDGMQALERLSRHSVDAALIDIGLPGMDGYALCEAIRARPEGTRMTLVALTGYGQDEDVRRAHAAGFDLHITKPAAHAELAIALARAAAPREGRSRRA